MSKSIDSTGYSASSWSTRSRSPLAARYSASQLKKILADANDNDFVELSLQVIPRNSSVPVSRKYETLARKLALALYESQRAISRLAEIEEENYKKEKKSCKNPLNGVRFADESQSKDEAEWLPEIYYDKRDGYNTGAHGLAKEVQEVLDSYEISMLKLACEGD